MDIKRLRTLAGVKINEASRFEDVDPGEFFKALGNSIKILDVKYKRGSYSDSVTITTENDEVYHIELSAQDGNPIYKEVGEYDDSMSPEDNVRQVFDRSKIGN